METETPKERTQLTFDYQKLDEYLTKWIDPQRLNELFRILHCEFTKTLIIAYNEGSSQGNAVNDELLSLTSLDEFFHILGNLEKGGES